MKKKSDQFSAADVMATALIIETFNDVEVGWVRKNLAKFVEFAYAINGDRFDHHQKGGGNVKRENGVPYSSAGIFWREIGRIIIGDDDPNVEMIWSIIDQELITDIDAHDNGKRVSDLSYAIRAFNPTCQEKHLSSDECFKNAVSVARQIFQRRLEHARAKALDTSKIKKVFEASPQFSAADVMATALIIEIFNDVEVGWVRKNLAKFVKFAYAINFEGGDRFDHHQKGGGNGKRENGVPYSSSGIFWREIGRIIIGDDDPNVEMIWSIIDQELITDIDAHDNGKRVSDLSYAISAFNPTCHENLSSDECFKNAVSVARQIFQRKLEQARALALDASKIKKVFEASPRGELVLPKFS